MRCTRPERKAPRPASPCRILRARKRRFGPRPQRAATCALPPRRPRPVRHGALRIGRERSSRFACFVRLLVPRSRDRGERDRHRSAVASRSLRAIREARADRLASLQIERPGAERAAKRFAPSGEPVAREAARRRLRCAFVSTAAGSLRRPPPITRRRRSRTAPRRRTARPPRSRLLKRERPKSFGRPRRWHRLLVLFAGTSSSRSTVGGARFGPTVCSYLPRRP